jgi:hypothetical protein
MTTMTKTVNEVIENDCKKILKEHHLRSITCDDNNGDVYIVDASPLIHTFHGFSICNNNYNRKYEVFYSGGTDNSHGKLWECNCRAGQHGYDCNHVKAVIKVHKHLIDVFGWEGIFE